MNPQHNSGDILVIEDHVNLMWDTTLEPLSGLGRIRCNETTTVRAALAGGAVVDIDPVQPLTFQGGTSEINRNNIAERGLGLPRAR